MLGLCFILAVIQDPDPVLLRVDEPVRLELDEFAPVAAVVVPKGEVTLHVRSAQVDAAAGIAELESTDLGAGTDERRWIAPHAAREWRVGAEGDLPAVLEVEVTHGRFEPSPEEQVRAELGWYRAAHAHERFAHDELFSLLVRLVRAHGGSAPAPVLEVAEFAREVLGPAPGDPRLLSLLVAEFKLQVGLGDAAGAAATGTALLAAEADADGWPTATRYQVLRLLGKGWVDLEEYSRARPALARALELELDDHARAELVALLTDAEVHSGRYAVAWTWLRELEDYCAGPAPKAKLIADCASLVSALAQPGEALRLLDDHAEHIEGSGDAAAFQAAQITRGLALEALEDFAAADEAYGRGLSPPGRAPARGWNRFALSINRARCRRLSGDLDGALECAREASLVARELRSPDTMAIAMDLFALILLEREMPLFAAPFAVLASTCILGSENVEHRLAIACTGARVRVALGEHEPARAALAETERLLDERCRSLSPEAAASVRSGFVTWAELGIDLALAWSERSPERAQELAGHALRGESRWKGRGVLGAAGVVDPADPADPGDFLRRVREGLGDRVLVEYAAGARDLCALVVSRRGVTLHRLGDRREVRDRARRFTTEVLFEALLSPAALEVAGHELFEILLGRPLAAHGADLASELVIAPTPELSLLPFEALVTGRPGAPAVSYKDLDYLVRTTVVTTTPSALFLASRARGPAPEIGRALILGDPIYTDVLGPDGAQLRRLTYTKDECAELAQLLLPRDAPGRDRWVDELSRATAPTRRSFRSGEDLPVQLRLGAAATPDELDGDLRAYSLLYFAGHAHGNPVRAGDCLIQLSPNPEGRRELTFDEIRHLGLGPALVVLAACESAVGPVQRGDGLLSLASAFLSAGARDVLATRGRVGDQATFALMSDFARRLTGFDGQSGTYAAPTAEPAHALRWALLQALGEKTDRGGLRASQGVQDRAGHPISWARYVLCGS